MSSNSSPSSSPPPPPPQSNSGGTVPGSPLQNVVQFMTSNKVNALLWLTRMGTLVFTILYLIPLGMNPYTCYQRALMSNAATSALRLHQRLPQVRLSREFLALFLTEDSCHYLFYSLIFLYTYPVTICLIPIFLFALLHSASYTLQILDMLQLQGSLLSRAVTGVFSHQRNILRIVAMVEIFIMPMTVLMIFTGRGTLLVPFIYFRFLTFRYSSRRNPYTRGAFSEMRLSVESTINHPNCPAAVRGLGYKLINLVSHFAPPVPPSAS